MKLSYLNINAGEWPNRVKMRKKIKIRKNIIGFLKLKNFFKVSQFYLRNFI